jgi:alanine racemase
MGNAYDQPAGMSRQSFNSRVRLEIDLDRLGSNYQAITAHCAPLRVMAVLKANAYGLGVRGIAERLVAEGVDAIGVAELREAAAVCDLGVPVHILGALLSSEVAEVVRLGIVAPVTDVEGARRLSIESVQQGRDTPIHFLVDTGMGRLGIPLREAREAIPLIASLPGLFCHGIYSHFPEAYGDAPFSNQQVTEFDQLLADLAKRGLSFKSIHLANSDGINNIEASIQAPFTMVRTGINLYGVFDMAGARSLPLRPVLRMTTQLVAVRELPAGSNVGYGRTCTLDKETRVGTVAIGYADGLPMAMSNGGGCVVVRGRRCPILGRVSMDYTTVDLTAVPDAGPGDEVICLGDEITVADWAAAKGTITYEVICSFGNRVERRYVQRAVVAQPTGY